MSDKEEWIEKIKSLIKPEYDDYSSDDLKNLIDTIIYKKDAIPDDVKKDIESVILKRDKDFRFIYYLIDEVQFLLFPDENTYRIKYFDNYDKNIKAFINGLLKVFIREEDYSDDLKLIEESNKYLKDYYSDLLLMQYQKPKAIAEIKALIGTTLKFYGLNYLKRLFKLNLGSDQITLQIGQGLGIPQDSGQFKEHEKWVFGVYDQKKGKYEAFVRGLTDSTGSYEAPFTEWIDNTYYKDKTAVLPLYEYKVLIQFLLEYYGSKPNLDHCYNTLYKYFRRGIEVMDTREHGLLILIINKKDLVLSAIKFNSLIVPFINQQVTIMYADEYYSLKGKNEI